MSRRQPAQRVYLAGPMRGYDQFNFPAFHEATKVLRKAGFDVLSPAEHDEDNGFDPSLNSLEGFNMEEAFRWDVECVLSCECVVVLPGWEKSSGASLEVAIARAIGTPVRAYPSLDKVEPMKVPESIAQEAHRLVNGDRQACYGHPADDFARTAALWNGAFGWQVRPQDVGIAQVLVKVSREMNAHKRDNLVDIAGYAATLELVHSRG